MQKNTNLCVDLKTVMQKDAHLVATPEYLLAIAKTTMSSRRVASTGAASEIRSCLTASIAASCTCKTASTRSTCGPLMLLPLQTATNWPLMSIPSY